MVGDARAPEMPWMAAYLTVTDPGKLADFYVAAFGFTKRTVMTDEAGQAFHAEVAYHDGVVMLGKADPAMDNCVAPAVSGTPSPVSLYVYVDEVDTVYARALDMGATSVVPPADMYWGDRMCTVADPDGHRWTLAKHLGQPAPTA